MCASFCAGTRISTTRGRVRVEKLRLGDEALTVSNGPLPIRWIGQRIYGRHFARMNPNSVPVMIKAGAIDDGVPLRDVCISPLHNVFIDGALIPVAQLVNGTSVITCADMDPIAYYHLELPVHALVLAEEMPAESYVDRGDRAMFLSGTAREPGDVGQTKSWASCAPIVNSGPLVDRVRARLAWRAGITSPDIMDRPQSGPLLGKLEWVDHTVVSGWAWLTDHPTVPVVSKSSTRARSSPSPSPTASAAICGAPESVTAITPSTSNCLARSISNARTASSFAARRTGCR
jgi:hypothetical protein